MPETSSIRRASRSVRIGALALVTATLALGARSVASSGAWLGRDFPGFLLGPDDRVAAIDVGWPGGRVPRLYGSRVLEVGDARAPTREQVYAHAAAVPVGSEIRYRLRRAGSDRTVAVPTARFGHLAWAVLFVPYFLDGAVFLLCALVVWVLRPHSPLGRALLAVGITGAVFFLSVPELYGPAPSGLWRLHLAGAALLPAAVLRVALLFPRPHRAAARAGRAAWAIGALLLVALQAGVARPDLLVIGAPLARAFLLAASALFVVRLVTEWRRAPAGLARQRARVATIGALAGLALPAALAIAGAVVPGGVALGLGALTPFIVPIAILYALVQDDLFELDAAAKRGAYYLVLTGTVGALYVGAFVVLNLAQAQAVTDSPAFPVFFTLAVLLLFNPLRARLQAFVDRVFFRTRYDGAQVLAAVGGELAATLDRARIATLVCEAVDGAIPNARTRLFIAGPTGDLVDAGTALPAVLEHHLAGGAVLTAFDPVDQAGDAATHTAIREALAALAAEVVVPLTLREELGGALTAGPKRSGLSYSAGDVEFLRALAHQAAIALENARSYEALVALNARLETRVRDRSAQLEGANRELEDATHELRSAEAQLVQSEKMASLGRLVASVAHEINNPVSFIAASVEPLRRRLESAATAAPPPVAKSLREAGEIVAVMARGAERTAAIVKDLRSFSRLADATRRPVDLHEGLEASVRLLESRWRGRVTIHRDYGVLPAVACDPAQMNQVFLNLLSNACDAIAETGNVWLTTRVDGDAVVVTVRDDGVGMPPDVLRRVFDPFFTTKDVGRGTGLGLAISHGVVAAHGGRIEVESEPGAGATFRVHLPVESVDSLDSAANAGR